ncbi:COP9 signalosome complex subunit 7a [Mortierella polycephala]|uniref:COP9 signalosome complex subunit 7a n=1 Tax=Mortierella polycephala TaxID=41804 RepID=A0A9P6QD45_9FUNG|nr:COP9 signalosome complex subunit 7a [Mortierella polycephala]
MEETSTAAAPASGESFKSLFGRRLEPYLALSKSAKGAGCVQLIKDVLTAPGVMVFGELLDMPNVAELKTHPDHARYHKLLEIFSFGTYYDYQQNRDSLPEITEVQRTKLQQLSIVTLSEQKRAIPYKDLLEYLDIANVRQLEDLIMDAIYQNVINANLDQRLKLVEVHSAMGRDLRPGQAQVMLKVLEDWTKTSEALLQALNAKMTQVQENYEKEKLAKEAFEKELEKMKKDNTTTGSGKHRKLGGGGPHMMDYEMGDQHIFQSPEFMGEYERVSYNLGGVVNVLAIAVEICRGKHAEWGSWKYSTATSTSIEWTLEEEDPAE